MLSVSAFALPGKSSAVVTEIRLYGFQSQKYLLFGPLQIKFADPWIKGLYYKTVKPLSYFFMEVKLYKR